jgi:hypothetical protein
MLVLTLFFITDAFQWLFLWQNVYLLFIQWRDSDGALTRRSADARVP